MGEHNITSERSAWTTIDGHDGAQSAGRHAEELAARFLERNGLTVLARNVRCRGGELDLVCRDGKALVFVEVRLRRNERYGDAAASITPHKQRRVILAARHFLASHERSRDADAACRFDCVLLDGERIDWLRDAFSAD